MRLTIFVAIVNCTILTVSYSQNEECDNLKPDFTYNLLEIQGTSGSLIVRKVKIQLTIIHVIGSLVIMPLRQGIDHL